MRLVLRIHYHVYEEITLIVQNSYVRVRMYKRQPFSNSINSQNWYSTTIERPYYLYYANKIPGHPVSRAQTTKQE